MLGKPLNREALTVVALALGCAILGSQHSVAQSVPIRGDAWITVRAHDGVTLRLPGAWLIQDEPANVRQQENGNTVVDLAGLPQGPTTLLLQASSNTASVTVSVIRGKFATQRKVEALSTTRIKSIDSDFRADLEQAMKVENAKMLWYGGTTRERLGNTWSLVARYKYQMPNGKPIFMESHRVFLGTRSIGFMLQTPPGIPPSVQGELAVIRGSFNVEMPN